MAIPQADPKAEKIDLGLAADIARTLNGKQAAQLRDIIDVNLSMGHGWDDHRVNQALHRRGLVYYIVSDDSRHVGGGVWKTRSVVTDVKPTAAGRMVADVYDLLVNAGELTARPLGERQLHALRTLAEHHNGQWWPGCGWAWSNRSVTISLLQSLADRGLAERTATAAGDPMFKITTSGRVRSEPLVMRYARLIADRKKAEKAEAGA